MKLSKTEKKSFQEILNKITERKAVQRMKLYTQHGKVSTYDHCERVAETSFWLNRRLHLHSDEKALVRGAMLHDFYLYDWHASDNGAHRLHGFTHPAKALDNAKQHFHVTPKEENIIKSHMWPLTLRSIPTCREAAIVCVADKICSAEETLFKR